MAWLVTGIKIEDGCILEDNNFVGCWPTYQSAVDAVRMNEGDVCMCNKYNYALLQSESDCLPIYGGKVYYKIEVKPVSFGHDHTTFNFCFTGPLSESELIDQGVLKL